MNKGFLSPKSVSKDSTSKKNVPGQHLVNDSHTIKSGLKVIEAENANVFQPSVLINPNGAAVMFVNMFLNE